MNSTESLVDDRGIYFECSLEGMHCLIDATATREVVSLPLLSPTPGASSHILGLLNLRGELLPVLDIRRVLELEVSPFQLSDEVVVLERDDLRFALHISAANGLREVSGCESARASHHIFEEESSPVYRVLPLDEGVFHFLAFDRLAVLLQSVTEDDAPYPSFKELLPAEFESEFTRRTLDLQASLEEVQQARDGFAVIRIDQELFGVSLSSITEFLKIEGITPVPCCPDHIVGNINCRGEVLTVIDISECLSLQLQTRHAHFKKILVVGERRDALGILIDEIYDVQHLQQDEIRPCAEGVVGADEGYILGVASCGKGSLTILSLENVLRDGNWAVGAV